MFINSLRLRTPDGKVTTVIGKCGPGQSPQGQHADGPASDARLSAPHGLCQLADGSILIADTGNHCIRMLDARMKDVVTIAGRPNKAGHADGKGSAAQFQTPFDILVARDPKSRHEVVYVSDRDDSTLRRLTLLRDAANKVKRAAYWKRSQELFPFSLLGGSWLPCLQPSASPPLVPPFADCQILPSPRKPTWRTIGE